MARRHEGAALMVAGYGAVGPAAFEISVIHTLGQIGESLLASGVPWQVRRLNATTLERYGADRGTIKHHLDELTREPVKVALVVILGDITEVDGQLALVTSAQHAEYPEDGTLPFTWIRERLVNAKAEQLVVVVSSRSDQMASTRWLGALATHRPLQLVAVDAADAGCPLADALLTGLCGDALDPTTGTVTLSSLGEHLVRQVPRVAIQRADNSVTFATPPPFAGLWDVRRSQLESRTAQHRRGEINEELVGIVLPGRFRVDELVARGTFGSVYRARQLAVERDVAVKVLHADISPSSDDGRLFINEIRAVGRIDHPNVVRIHQADITHDGRLFYAMELLGGRDLQQVIGDGRLPRDRALDLIGQLLAGLAAAHDTGLVHADVKPANVIVIPKDVGERAVLVDFGLSRLRSTESVGGTPAYMAPEQLHEGRVDTRSDLFSAALVFVHMLTSWRRPSAHTLVPPIDLVDADLRPILARAFAIDPAERYQTARELAAALAGQVNVPSQVAEAAAVRVPFRHLTPFTEADRARFLGREEDIGLLVESVLYRRSVIYTAPSGTGKTSVLRAGLIPRLDSLAARGVYLQCRTDTADTLATAIWPGETTIARAISQHHHQRGTKLVLVIDQIEALLTRDRDEPGDRDLLTEVLDFDRWPAEADVTVVFSVREDQLARLVDRTQEIEPNIPVVRLPPLSMEGAREAIVTPLTENRLDIEPELLEALLADLATGAGALAPEMGWTSDPAAYPPHLQLACTVLYDALGSGESVLALSHYRSLGGFEAIVGEHLERVVETELEGSAQIIAKDLFLALVTGHERAMRAEDELVEIAGHGRNGDEVLDVLEMLRARGLVVRVRVRGEPTWELIHDSLVARVLAWVDRRDLAKRRALELVRYRLRRSRPEALSLLDRDELHELRDYDDDVAELDAEWKLRNEPITPLQLVKRSKYVHRRRQVLLASMVVVAATIAGVSFRSRQVAEQRESEEHDARIKAENGRLADQLQIARNIGSFELQLEPFDWDPRTLKPIAVSPSELQLSWKLYAADRDQPSTIGELVAEDHVLRGPTRLGKDNTLNQVVSAPGGVMFLVVSGRGRGEKTHHKCRDSIIPLKALPGARDYFRAVRVPVPTCQATFADTLEIPAGSFIYGGDGDPPHPWASVAQGNDPERPKHLETFFIDRTEVTNAAFAMLVGRSMIAVQGSDYPTRVHADDPPLPLSLRVLGERDNPVSRIRFAVATQYCAFMGKRLPSSGEWTKAMRGGKTLRDGKPNPYPRRNLPWGPSRTPSGANLSDLPDARVRAAGSSPADISPYGVLDMAGNVSEWIAPDGTESPGYRFIRGGNWVETKLADVAGFVASKNLRPSDAPFSNVGLRCVTD